MQERRRRIDEALSVIGNEPNIRPTLESGKTTPEHRERAAYWIETRKRDWLTKIDSRDYLKYGVSNTNIKEFCEDLEKHLDLLCKNIRMGLHGSPKRSRPPVNQRINPSISYRKALSFIQSQMKKELEEDSDLREWLTEDGIRALENYMNRLIEFIDK